MGKNEHWMTTEWQLWNKNMPKPLAISLLSFVLFLFYFYFYFFYFFLVSSFRYISFSLFFFFKHTFVLFVGFETKRVSRSKNQIRIYQKICWKKKPFIFCLFHESLCSSYYATLNWETLSCCSTKLIHVCKEITFAFGFQAEQIFSVNISYFFNFGQSFCSSFSMLFAEVPAFCNEKIEIVFAAL